MTVSTLNEVLSRMSPLEIANLAEESARSNDYKPAP